MRATIYLSSCLVGSVVLALASCGGTVTQSQAAGSGGGSGSSHSSTASNTVAASSSGSPASSSASTTSSTSTSSSSSASTSSSTSSGFVPDGGPVGLFPFPTVAYQGGPIVASPKIITITFPNDPMTTDLVSFGSTVTSSSYWDTIRAGYCDSQNNCIGDGTGMAVALTTPPAASYTDSEGGGTSSLQTFLGDLITAGTVPPPDANTIYALYFPSTTSITLDGAPSCDAFDGYHLSFQMGSQTVIYAVIPECSAGGLPITLLQNTTITASHEFIEAATDPSLEQTSYYTDFNDPKTYGWTDAEGGGEVGDICVDVFGLGEDETTENGYTVQRIWSNINAKAGKNPCVPIPPGEVYFNAFTLYSVLVMDVGKSEDIEVDALADGAMGAWTVTPQDWTDFQNPGKYLSFAIKGVSGSDTQMKSGDKIVVTVTLKADAKNTQNQEADGVIVSANGSMQSATAAHFWPFVVITTAEAKQYGISMEKGDKNQHRMLRRRSSLRKHAMQLFGAR